jgi:hypothetical protein
MLKGLSLMAEVPYTQSIYPGTTVVSGVAQPDAPQAGFGSGAMNLFRDPNFLALLAGIGANMDPEGPGGWIGRPAQQMINNVAGQTAMAEQEEKRKGANALAQIQLMPDGPEKDAALSQAIQMLAANPTIKGRPGATTVTRTPTGYNISAETSTGIAENQKAVATPPAPTEQIPAAATPPSAPAPAPVNVVPPTTVPQAQLPATQRKPMDLRALVPFYSAPVE